MKKRKVVAIIGYGSIAKHLAARLESMNIGVFFVRRGEYGGSISLLEKLLDKRKPEAVFVAISTLDTGEAARDYILACVRIGIPVITCEKGALAYHAEALKEHADLGNIGFSATVGGGTMMLKYIRSRRLAKKKVEIHAVINGTLNFVFSKAGQHGQSLGEACAEAIKLGYAEPGATEPVSLINGEIKDVKMKICVLFNTVLGQENILVPEKTAFDLTAADLERLSKVAGNYRLIVSFSNHKPSGKYQYFGDHMQGYRVENWYVSVGFRQVNNSSDLSWLPNGVGNAVHIIEGDLGSGGKYTLTGPGAGLEPTTSAMLADFAKLCP